MQLVAPGAQEEARAIAQSQNRIPNVRQILHPAIDWPLMTAREPPVVVPHHPKLLIHQHPQQVGRVVKVVGLRHATPPHAYGIDPRVSEQAQLMQVSPGRVQMSQELVGCYPVPPREEYGMAVDPQREQLGRRVGEGGDCGHPEGGMGQCLVEGRRGAYEIKSDYVHPTTVTRLFVIMVPNS